MISKEQRAKIRRLFFGEHWKVGTIARELGVGSHTVERAIEAARLGPRSTTRRAVPSILDPYKPFLLEVLSQHPRLRSTRLHQMACARGFAGSEITVRRWAKSVRPMPRGEAYFRLGTLPGEQAQVDCCPFLLRSDPFAHVPWSRTPVGCAWSAILHHEHIAFPAR